MRRRAQLKISIHFPDDFESNFEIIFCNNVCRGNYFLYYIPSVRIQLFGAQRPALFKLGEKFGESS